MASFEHMVSRNLQCPICFDLLSDPKQLSCTHTFCKKCLGDILASQNQANTVHCPICRSITDVKDGNVVNLNTNVPLKSLVDDVRNCKQLCEMCDKKSRAVRFCCDCGMHFCNVCLERHNNWPPHLNHKVVSVEDIREGKVVIEKKVYCQEHVHKTDGLEDVCTDVCTTCKKLICTRCRMIYHTKEKGHIVQDAGIYEASIKEEIESLQVRGKTKVATVNNHMACVDDQLKRVTDHADREKEWIIWEYEEAINKLKERKATINQRIEAQKRRSCQSLKKMKVEDKSLADSIECASELVGRNLNAPLAGDIVAIRDSLSRILKNILDRDDPRKKLAIDVADRAEQLKFTLSHKYEWLRIGRMTFRFGFRSAFFLVLSLVLFEFMLSPAQLQIGLRCEVEFPRKDSMNYMTVTPDGRMAVGYHNGGIDVFSPDGQLQQTVLKDVRILGVGFLSNDRYVVNTWNKITLYTSTWEKLSVSFESLSIREGGIGSLTVDSGLIYVGYWKAQKIQVFSPDGMAIREIPCDGYEPMQIASYGNVLIVKQDSNGVIIIDKEGNIKHELTKSSDHCLYAAVSNNNSVLIATIKDEEGLLSIDEHTTELKHMKTLVSDFKIEKPEKRKWYYLQQFRSGEIAFCTPDRLYIFHKQILPNGKTNEGDAIESDSSDGEEFEEEPVMSDEEYDEEGDEEKSEEEPVMSDEEYDEEDDEEEFDY